MSTLWIGGYPPPEGGIGWARHLSGAELQDPVLAAPAANPSYLATSPERRVIYAVAEQPDGQVAAYSRDPEGLRLLGTQPTGGADPCHVAVHPAGGYLLTANYSSGSVAVHPIRDDGSLEPRSDLVRHIGSGPISDRQDGPHAHMVAFDPSGELVFAVDLGADAVIISRLDLTTGRLEPNGRLDLPAGSGPRHLAFHSSGSHAYVVNELDNTVSLLSHHDGNLTLIGTVPCRAEGATGDNSPAAILISADDRFLYVSNRGDDTITWFALSDNGSRLSSCGSVSSGGHWPRHLSWGLGRGVDAGPDRRRGPNSDGATIFASNERSDSIAVFRVDPRTGAPTQTGAAASWPRPTCVLPVP